jgi:hypothetical protein
MSEPGNTPKRLRSSDVIASLQATMAAMAGRSHTRVPTVTVDLTWNAKGDTQISVQVQSHTDTDPAALRELADTVLDEATRIYDDARKAYPRMVPIAAPETGVKGKRS